MQKNQSSEFRAPSSALSIQERQWENMNKTLKWPGTEAAFLAGLRALASPTYYPVWCAWCEAEGVRTLVRWSTIEHSSGICKRHVAEMNAELGTRNAEGGLENHSHPVNPVDPVGVSHEEEPQQAPAL